MLARIIAFAIGRHPYEDEITFGVACRINEWRRMQRKTEKLMPFLKKNGGKLYIGSGPNE